MRRLRWFGVAAVGYGLAAGLLAVLVAIFGDATWWLSIATISIFWWLGPAVPLALWALLRRRWLRVIACGPAAACWLLLFVPWFVPQTQAGSADFRVATYNVAQGLDDVSHVETLVAQERPDVLLLQDISPRQGRQLARTLPELPHRYIAPPDGEDTPTTVAVLSRFPIVGVREIPLATPRSRPTGVALLDVAGRAVQVASLHLTSPCQSCEEPRRWDRLGAEAERRREEMAAVLDGIGPEPVVLGGDFNSGPVSDPRRAALRAGLADSHQAAGSGPGFTKGVGRNSSLTLFRIDYLFAGAGAQPVRSWEADAGPSDHRPVISDLRLPPT